MHAFLAKKCMHFYQKTHAFLKSTYKIIFILQSTNFHFAKYRRILQSTLFHFVKSYFYKVQYALVINRQITINLKWTKTHLIYD